MVFSSRSKRGWSCNHKEKHMSRKKKWSVVIFLVLLVVITTSFMMQISTGGLPTFPHIDKVVHFVFFFALAWAFYHAFPIPIVWALLILTAYGFLVEYVQGTLPHRSASYGDLLADAAGAGSFYLYTWWRVMRHRKRQAKLSS
ncbi:VanZ family protein [Pseudidiomarina sediminum]|nr:VanZ family protein [Pseudidiomarina sediminum]MBY6064944.1 VanZ family protein [Pseudidiomarina sediminum]